MMSTKKRKLGRPPVDTEALTVRMSAVALKEIDEWRRRQEDLPTRAEAIRRLVAAALKRGGGA
jgi:hypothetical protein